LSDTTMQNVLDECVPLIKLLGTGRYAIAIGGSRGKGTSDHTSDVDFRLYCDEMCFGTMESPNANWDNFVRIVDSWRVRGVEIDHVWIRTIDQINTALDAWMEGDIQPEILQWSVWGYHLLPDLFYQQNIEDPYGIVSGWKERLSVYPAKLKESILQKHLGSACYWRGDYHYAHKVVRKDPVFLASLSARLVHDLMQVIFALNDTYYVGDGSNLEFARHFAIKPADFEERIISVLYPAPGDELYARQRQLLVDLINETESLVSATRPI